MVAIHQEQISTRATSRYCDACLSKWIAMKCNKKWFIGKKKVEGDGEDCVNFMARGKGNNTTANFTWPKREDVLWIKRENILCVIESPVQASKTHMTFQLSAATVESIEERFQRSGDKA